MSGFLGMVPEDVEGLAGELDQRAGQVEAIVQSVTGTIGQTTWRGADRDAFEAHWSGELASALQGIAETLRETGRIARTNAAQQREASS